MNPSPWWYGGLLSAMCWGPWFGAATCSGQVASPPQVRSFPLPSEAPDTAELGATTTTSSADTPPPGPARAPAAAHTAQRFATNQRTFAIPFAVDSAQAIVGVNLFVSYDRGRVWERHSQIALSKSAFDFVAQQEGEFWFAIQTVTRSGELAPPKVTTPDLIVLVDQRQPTIEITASDDAAGRVQVTWNATDEHLASNSLRIRYRPLPAGGENWLEVPGQHPAGEAIGPVYRDSLAFWPEGSATAYEIAVTIADTAGNEVTGNTTCARSQPKQMLVDARTQASSSGASVLESALRKPPTPESLATPVEWLSQVDSPSGQHVIQNSTRAATPSHSSALPQTPTPQPFISDTGPTPTPVPSENSTEKPLANNTGAGTQATALQAPPRLINASNPARNDSERRSILAASDLLEQAIPVNSTRFRLNYQVESLALADFQEVVIWVTRDQGASWNRLGTSPNPTGPYAVSVDGSGMYGFRLVVTGRNGLKGRIPQPGDSADKWVLVDVEPPRVQITGAPFGTGENSGKLIVQWQIEEQRLDLRPIELAYSTSPEGPWAPIENNLRNTGSYAWEVDPNALERVYLRITARDAAGNRGSAQTTQPIDLANLFPRGRIQSVEPIR